MKNLNGAFFTELGNVNPGTAKSAGTVTTRTKRGSCMTFWRHVRCQ